MPNEMVEEWVQKAEEDYRAIVRLEPEETPYVICFHCQQCAEKYLKALLVFFGVAFPKTHDLRLLLDLIQPRVSLGLSRARVVALNRYIIEGRYPGNWEPITIEEAKHAMGAAKDVRAAVRSLLAEEIRRAHEHQ